MYRLRVKDHFDSAHQLPGHPGKCRRIHGHTWYVEARFIATGVNAETGMAVDFSYLKTLLGAITERLDHFFINEEVPEFVDNLPTAELLAQWIYGELKVALMELRREQASLFPAEVNLGLEAIVVWESPGAGVEYFEGMTNIVVKMV